LKERYKYFDALTKSIRFNIISPEYTRFMFSRLMQSVEEPVSTPGDTTMPVDMDHTV